MRYSCITVEELEARIAPASVLFTDVDGDTVKVTTSKGTDAALQSIVTAGLNLGQMENFVLTPDFAGSDVKFLVTARGATGDGVVNVHYIDATGIDLGAVEVAGDLAKLRAGDSNYSNGSVKSIKVQSVGAKGGATDKVWSLFGGTNTVNVAGDVIGATLAWSNPNTLSLLTVNSITIGGNLVGGTADGTGSVLLMTGQDGLAELKSITVGGSLIASDFDKTGSIIVGDTLQSSYAGNIGKAVIGGSLNGDDNHQYSGCIFAMNALGPVTVGGSLLGGGAGSGSIVGYMKMYGEINVKGSVAGGAGSASGSIHSSGDILKPVKIGGALQGGAGGSSGEVYGSSLNNVTVGAGLIGGSGNSSGTIYSKHNIGNVWIGGSVLGGTNSDAGSIQADGAVGDITIKGDLRGGSAEDTGEIYVDSAGKISIGGSVIAGNNSFTGMVYTNIAAKSLSIGGDLIGGTLNYSGTVRMFGQTSKMGAVSIGGSLLGDTGVGSGSVKILGAIDKLTIGGAVEGGLGADSASVTFGSVKSLSIGVSKYGSGSIYGGGSGGAGVVTGTSLGSVSIAGHIVGGSTNNTGIINLTGTKDLSVGGSVIGGTWADSGSIIIGTGGVTGKLSVAGDLIGTDDQRNTGMINVNGKVASMEIGGSIIGGDSTKFAKTNSGVVLVSGMLKSLVVGGDILAGIAFNNLNDYSLGAVRAGAIDTMLVKGGLSGANSTSPVIISGQGDTSKTSGANVAIKSLTVLGSVNNAMILGGYGTTGSTIGGSGGTSGGGAQIGTVIIGGDFTDSSIVTGVKNNSGAIGSWGSGSNSLLDLNPIVASIAKVVISGSCDSTVQNGIVAERINSLSVGGLAVPVAAGAQSFTVAGMFRVQQVVA